jgi:hypothetical protein
VARHQRGAAGRLRMTGGPGGAARRGGEREESKGQPE